MMRIYFDDRDRAWKMIRIASIVVVVAAVAEWGCAAAAHVCCLARAKLRKTETKTDILKQTANKILVEAVYCLYCISLGFLYQVWSVKCVGKNKYFTLCIPHINRATSKTINFSGSGVLSVLCAPSLCDLDFPFTVWNVVENRVGKKPSQSFKITE